MDEINTKNLLTPDTKKLRWDFWVSVLLVAIFLFLSGFLVMQLQNADRAEDRETNAKIRLKELNKDIPQKKAAEKVLSESIVVLQADLAGLNEKYNIFSKKFKEAQKVVNARNQASQEYSDISARIHAGEKTLDELHAERDQLIQMMANIRKKRGIEQEAVSALQQEKLQLNTVVQDLQQKKRELDRLETVVEKLSKEKKKIASENATVSNEIISKQKRLIAMKSDLVDIRSKNATLDVSVRNKQIEEKTLVSDIERMKNQLANIKVEVSESTVKQEEFLTLRKQITIAKAEVEHLQEVTALLQERKKSLDSKILEISTQLVGHKSELENLARREASLLVKEERLGDLDTAILHKKTLLAELEEKLEEKKNEGFTFDVKSKSLKEREAIVEEREHQVIVLKEKIAAQMAIQTNKNLDLSRRETSLLAKKKRLGDLDSAILQKKSVLLKLDKELKVKEKAASFKK